MRAHGIRAIVPDPDEAVDEASAAGSAGTHGPVLQVEHLHDLGHHRIAIASTSDPRLAYLARQRGEVAMSAAERFGMTYLPPAAVDGEGLDLATLVRRWVDDGVSAVVAYNDDIAAIVVGAALSAGLGVPEHLSVIRHDDSPLASLFLPRLSSISLDGTALGRLIADLVLARIEGRSPEPAVTGGFESVVARDSTRRVDGDSRPGRAGC